MLAGFGVVTARNRYLVVALTLVYALNYGCGLCRLTLFGGLFDWGYMFLLFTALGLLVFIEFHICVVAWVGVVCLRDCLHFCCLFNLGCGLLV